MILWKLSSQSCTYGAHYGQHHLFSAWPAPEWPVSCFVRETEEGSTPSASTGCSVQGSPPGVRHSPCPEGQTQEGKGGLGYGEMFKEAIAQDRDEAISAKDLSCLREAAEFSCACLSPSFSFSVSILLPPVAMSSHSRDGRPRQVCAQKPPMSWGLVEVLLCVGGVCMVEGVQSPRTTPSFTVITSASGVSSDSGAQPTLLAPFTAILILCFTHRL